MTLKNYGKQDLIFTKLIKSLCCIGLIWNTCSHVFMIRVNALDVDNSFSVMSNTMAPTQELLMHNVLHNYHHILSSRFNYWSGITRRAVMFGRDFSAVKQKSLLQSFTTSAFLQHESLDLKIIEPDYQMILMPETQAGIQNRDVLQIVNYNVSQQYKLGAGLIISDMSTYLFNNKTHYKKNINNDHSYGRGKLFGMWAGMSTNIRNLQMEVASGVLYQKLVFNSLYKVLYETGLTSDQYPLAGNRYNMTLPHSKLMISKKPQTISVMFVNANTKYLLPLQRNIFLNFEINVLIQGINLYKLTQYISSYTPHGDHMITKDITTGTDNGNLVQGSVSSARTKMSSTDTPLIHNSIFTVNPSMTYSVPVEFKLGLSTYDLLNSSLHLITYVAGSIKTHIVNPTSPTYHYSVFSDQFRTNADDNHYRFKSFNHESFNNTETLSFVTYGLSLGFILRTVHNLTFGIAYQLSNTHYSRLNKHDATDNISYGINLFFNLQL